MICVVQECLLEMSLKCLLHLLHIAGEHCHVVKKVHVRQVYRSMPMEAWLGHQPLHHRQGRIHSGSMIPVVIRTYVIPYSINPLRQLTPYKNVTSYPKHYSSDYDVKLKQQKNQTHHIYAREHTEKPNQNQIKEHHKTIVYKLELFTSSSGHGDYSLTQTPNKEGRNRVPQLSTREYCVLQLNLCWQLFHFKCF